VERLHGVAQLVHHVLEQGGEVAELICQGVNFTSCTLVSTSVFVVVVILFVLLIILILGVIRVSTNGGGCWSIWTRSS
jgi:uncharacterized membrane protein YdbT with pleckstrin-like domain